MPTQLVEQDEDIEGLDEGNELGLADYPIDSVLIRPEQRTVFEVMRRITANTYVLDPDFQRDFVWDETKQSRLVESLLMRIPLPVFYLAERSDGKVIVVDGLQRLTTLSRFLDNAFILRNTDVDKGKESKSENVLDGKKFSDLPLKFQSRIEDSNLILYVIDPKVPERARLDIFERVNSGVPLSRQQMRNSLYSGQATRWLKEQSIHPDFLAATDKGLNTKTMRDREVINRFCAFSILGAEKYTGDMDAFLGETLSEMQQMSTLNLEDLAIKFQKSMRNNYAVFGSNAFRKVSETGRRGVLNVALFDILSVTMAEKDAIDEDSHHIQRAFDTLLHDDVFRKSITYSTNSAKQVVYRFRAWNEALRRL